MEYRINDSYRVYWKKYFTFGVEQGARQGLDLLMEEQVASLCAEVFERVRMDPLWHQCLLKQYLLPC